jgi:CRP-like cAMP-binding protein
VYADSAHRQREGRAVVQTGCVPRSGADPRGDDAILSSGMAVKGGRAMNAETTMALLRRQAFVEGLSERWIEKLAALAKEVRFERDRVLFGEGEESTEFYLIVSGMVALEIAPPGDAFRLDTLTAGDEFGFSAVLGQKTVFQARVLQDMHALAFDAAKLRALCETDTAFGYEFMRRLMGIVSDRLQVTRLHLMDTYWPVAKRAGA